MVRGLLYSLLLEQTGSLKSQQTPAGAAHGACLLMRFLVNEV